MSKLFYYQKRPLIYIYSMPNQTGFKIGYTENITKTHDDLDAIQTNLQKKLTNNPKYQIEHYELALTNSGAWFDENLVYEFLERSHIPLSSDNNYKVKLSTLKSILHTIKTNTSENLSKRKNFRLRPEQIAAIEKTSQYFQTHASATKPPRFLWNAKMRFGKTFTAYELAKKMGWTRILILTYKPGVEKEWRHDLENHVDFAGWQFIEGLSSWDEHGIDEDRPVVWFASYQDVLGTNHDGKLKDRHRKMHEITWDSIFVDEYHFGAWRDSAKELSREEKSEKLPDTDLDEATEIEQTLPLKSHCYLYLSGTPFRALADGEFSEDQIFNWTYADEQHAKKFWRNPGANPYQALPQIVMMTYQMPENLRQVATQGDFNEFDLNKFFSATKNKAGEWMFQHETAVQNFLNILHGVDLEITIENKYDYRAPVLPFEDARLLSALRHTFWFLPDVPACRAMERLLQKDQFFQQYQIIRAAGNDTPGGKNAKTPVENAIGNGLNTHTITLSCGKLTTGVTIPAWAGVLFLRNIESPETYFQTIFRAQSPWTISHIASPTKPKIIKPTCYVFDFAPNRALKLIAEYSNSLASTNDDRRPEQRLEEFIEFLPVLCYDGTSMRRLQATEILDISTYGTASTMLARRWQSARLVDVTSAILEKVLNNAEILTALEKIEDFRNLRNDLSKVISREKAVHAAKKQRAEVNRAATEEELTAEKAEKKQRLHFKKKLREKLLKFITRIPVFMYLTDYREEALIDVIRNIEPELFVKVTGLTIHEFNLMCEIGVFNQIELNSAIAQFRRFEDASLEYVGGRSAHDGEENIGLFDTIVTRREANEIIESEIGK